MDYKAAVKYRNVLRIFSAAASALWVIFLLPSRIAGRKKLSSFAGQQQGWDFNKAVNYISGLEKLGWIFILKRMKDVLKKLGNPQRGLRYVHVTGTNGKGSVVAMLNSILQDAGYSVGTYTSPHLVNIRERITLNKTWISRNDFVRLAEKVKKTGATLTFFEFLTALGFLYFKEKKPDIVLLEVGLGGRLDATNVIKPEIAVVTNIALEHTDILGRTIEKIAKEKASIIKKGCAVVTGTRGRALQVVKKMCRKKNCKLIIAKPVDYKLKLKGDFQKFNAGIAVAVARQLKISERHIRAGLANAEWPARLEFFGNVLLDSAHNPNGIRAMQRFVKKLRYKRLIIVFGCLRDKNFTSMYRNLPEWDELIITKPKYKRALEPEKIPGKHKIIKDPVRAVKYARSIAKKKDLILICGSIYLAGDVRKILVKE